MANTIQVQTTGGAIAMPVMHKNGALQVVQAPLVTLGDSDTQYVFYNTVHDNGLRLPSTDTDVLADAILICNWCAENFPEFAKENLNTANIPPARQKEFSAKLRDYRFCELRDWEGDDDNNG